MAPRTSSLCCSIVSALLLASPTEARAQATSPQAELWTRAIVNCAAPSQGRVFAPSELFVQVDNGNSDDAQAVATARSKLLDRMFLANRTISISSVYKLAMTYRELPFVQLTESQQLNRDRALKTLMYQRTVWDRLLRRHRETAYSEKFEAYRHLKKDYARAADASKSSGSAAAKEAERQAFDAWNLYEFRSEVEGALEAARAVDEVAITPRWMDREERLAKAAAGAGLVPPVSTVPAASEWLADAGWVTCPPAEAAGSRLALQIKEIAIVRDWFDDDLFTDRHWRLSEAIPGGAGTLVSDGTGNPQTSRLPLVPDVAVLARNVTIVSNSGLNTIANTPRLVGWLARVPPRSPDPLADLSWTLPEERPRETRHLQAVGVFSGLGINADLKDGTSGIARNALPLNVYVRFSKADWLVVGTGAGPHVTGTGIVVGVAARKWFGDAVPMLFGLRMWKGDVRGVLAFDLPLWSSRSMASR